MAFVSRSRNVSGARYRRALFAPGRRGDLQAALADPAALSAIAPGLPRPVAWLRDGHVSRMRGTYARDMALFECLVECARDADPSLERQDLVQIPVRLALTVLSAGGRSAAPRELAQALSRLFDVSAPTLRIDGNFTYRLPTWTRHVMPAAAGGRYAYIDLNAMARFRKRSSALLYRQILGRLAEVKAQYAPDAAPVRLEFDPLELSDQLGQPVPHTPQLRTGYLQPALDEIRDHVADFAIDAVEEARSAGGTVTAFTFVVRPLPPRNLRAVRARVLDNGDFDVFSGLLDVPAYRVSVKTLIRAGSVLPSKILRPKGKPAPSLVSEVMHVYESWLAALAEALSDMRLTPGSETRRYRRERLMRAIEEQGPDQTFYLFALEEAEQPDLTVLLRERATVASEARRALRARVREHKVKVARARRAELQAARAEGTAPPPKPRKAPAPAEPIQATPVPPVSPDLTAEPWLAEHAAALQSDQAKTEAKALRDLWQMAQDFPFTHVGPRSKLLLQTFEFDFPLLARLDAERGGPYRQNIEYLMPLKRAPYMTTDAAGEYVIWLAMAGLVGIENGAVSDWAAKVLDGRAHCKKVILKDKADYAKAQEKARGRYVRGQRSSYEEEKRLNQATPIFLPPAEMDALIAFNERMRKG